MWLLNSHIFLLWFQVQGNSSFFTWLKILLRYLNSLKDLSGPQHYFGLTLGIILNYFLELKIWLSFNLAISREYQYVVLKNQVITGVQKKLKLIGDELDIIDHAF
jgi:hypothetical protein